MVKSVATLHMLNGGHAVFVTEPAGGAGRRPPGTQAFHSESGLEQWSGYPEHVIPVPMIHPLPGQLWHPEQLPFIDAI